VVSQQWIPVQSPDNIEDVAGVCAVGGLTLFTNVAKFRVNESGALTHMDFLEGYAWRFYRPHDAGHRFALLTEMGALEARAQHLNTTLHCPTRW